MCFTKLRVEVEQWEDEGVFLVSRLSVESVPAGDVVQEERDEEETCIAEMRQNLTLIIRHRHKPFSLSTYDTFMGAPLYSLITRLMSV